MNWPNGLEAKDRVTFYKFYFNNYRDDAFQVSFNTLTRREGMGSVFNLSWLICQIWGCVKIYQSHNVGFTYGSLTALIQLVSRIQTPIANAVNLISQSYGVVASAERLQEVIGLPDEEKGTALEYFDEIRLEKVNFQYEDGIQMTSTPFSFRRVSSTSPTPNRSHYPAGWRASRLPRLRCSQR